MEAMILGRISSRIASRADGGAATVAHHQRQPALPSSRGAVTGEADCSSRPVVMPATSASVQNRRRRAGASDAEAPAWARRIEVSAGWAKCAHKSRIIPPRIAAKHECEDAAGPKGDVVEKLCGVFGRDFPERSHPKTAAGS